MNRFPQIARTVILVVSWLALAAVAQARTHPQRPRPHAPRAGTHRVRTTGLAAASARGARLLLARPATRRRTVVHAHLAGDPGVSIVDFSFSPGTTTVHVGDTITWTNAGKQPHSATANDHSFDTGILRTGHSASHTFTTAGTFAYFCIVHPYMHATIIVLAATPTTQTTAGSTTTGHTTATTTTAPAATTATTATGATLPVTGTDDLAGFGLGALLVAAGFVLRARLAPAPERSPED